MVCFRWSCFALVFGLSATISAQNPLLDSAKTPVRADSGPTDPTPALTPGSESPLAKALYPGSTRMETSR